MAISLRIHLGRLREREASLGRHPILLGRATELTALGAAVPQDDFFNNAGPLWTVVRCRVVNCGQLLQPLQVNWINFLELARRSRTQSCLPHQPPDQR